MRSARSDTAVFTARVPTALRVAERFPEEVRFSAYVRLAYDRAQRNAQLVEACPGAFLFGLALQELGGPLEPVAEQFWRDVAAGLKINRALDQAILGWAHVQHLRAMDRAERCRTFDLSGSPEAAEEIVRAQRALVRRAGLRVALTDLLAPPPKALILEDVPEDPTRNAAWFRVMKRPLFFMAGELIDCVSRWASHEAWPLERAICGGDPMTAEESGQRLDRVLAEIVDYLRATGHRPHRSADPFAIVDRCARWHLESKDLFLAQERAREAMRTKSYDADHPLPAAPFPEARFGSMSVVPIRTVGELVEEGVTQQHCVASRLTTLLAGGRWIAKVTIGQTRITVEVSAAGPDGVEIMEAKGFLNACVSQDHRRMLDEWASHAAHPEKSWLARMAAGPASLKMNRASVGTVETAASGG